MSWLGNLRDRVFGTKFSNTRGALAVAAREATPLGPFSATLGNWLARKSSPAFYEALREALPPLDGGIDALVGLDGIVRCEGKNEALVGEVRDFIENVPVNDAQVGLQAVYAGMGNELYEQGCALAEWVPAKNGRSIAGLRVADSKGIAFVRDATGLRTFYRPPSAQAAGRQDGTDNVERILRGTAAVPVGGDIAAQLNGVGFAELDTSRLIYAVNAPEADNPYGTSKLRSIEFVSTILLVIQNATDQVWRRFGDPSFNVKYQTKNRKIDPTELDRRKLTLAQNLAAALDVKRKGNSSDFVNAIGADDDLTVEILGATDKILEIEMPARHLLEQVLAKFRIASWVLGYTWNTSDRSGDAQAEMMIMDSKTRWESRRPYLQRLVATELRLRGRTWNPGDWELVQEMPNLRDALKTAQADFLRAQTVLMLGGGGELPDSAAEPGSDPRGGGGKAFLAVRAALGPIADAIIAGKASNEKLAAIVRESKDGGELAARLAVYAREVAA